MMRDMTKHEIETFDSGHCPNCDSWAFYQGPCGGMMQNIECSVCGLKLNVSVAFPGGTIGQVLFEPVSYLKKIAPKVVDSRSDYVTVWKSADGKFGVSTQRREPEIQWNHVDGPVLYMSNASCHWLTWRERWLLWRKKITVEDLDTIHIMKGPSIS